MNIKALTREERKAFLVSLGEPAYREKQLFQWISRGVDGLDEMTDLPRPLREKLAESCTYESLAIAAEQISSGDGTRKFLLTLPDGNTVEAVFMMYEYGNTLCLSTQVGCAMGCSFCASGIGGKVRNLKAWEMLDQFLVCQKRSGALANHIVLMGMGEPFDNYAEVSQFLRTLHDPDGVGMSYRSMTVSTCGLIPKIRQFGSDFPQVNLAISLHGASQKEREERMPVAKAWPMQELMKACREYTEQTGRRITFEYALIEGENDDPGTAQRLAELLRGMLCHVNLIPLNPVTDIGLQGSSRVQSARFARILEDRGIPVSIRRQLGSDIAAACGQLRRNNS
ncbi:MAG TPA: 23S rRNA (adenine(2503)-C(2))-methyltransferase RlmN [Clostridiales bacterium]|nr:23S rRNA (adenine(2503)-C(2))-methyltransferase RlmN [Clostridiales bacterium]